MSGIREFVLAAAAFAFAAQEPTSPPPVKAIILNDNGWFGERPLAGADDERARRIPWWVTVSGEPKSTGWTMQSGEPGSAWGYLETGKGDAVRQPIPAFAGALRISGDLDAHPGLVVRGGLQGPGVMTLIDGAGAHARLAVPTDQNGDFRIPLIEFDALLPLPAVPRFQIELSNDGSDRPAVWGPIAVWVDLPCPPEAALRRMLVEELDWIFRLWLDEAIDRVGPRETSFTCHLLDVVTGAKLFTAEAVSQPQPIYELLLDAWAIEKDERWGAALERYLEDLLTLGLHPDTGLPRQWDCVHDVPLDRAGLEIAKAFHFLLDASEKGPEKFRERTLAAAKKLGDTILAKGILPDGSIAPIYVPADGTPRTDAASLRRLDVAAELARLAKATGDRRYLAAAERAVFEFEYTNFWPGDWKSIDPGFDDSFGHYGARAVTMLEAFPDDPVFRRVVASGWKVYGPLWIDALRFGGSIAADQVRCWDLLERYARLEPAARDEFRRTLAFAVRAHFKGEQYGNGAWGDVTFYDFDPKTGLSVGDLPGAPANLLWGLGLACRRGLELHDSSFLHANLDRDTLRAMYTAVFLSTRETYRRAHGYLSTERERVGANSAGGELRIARGLVEMLANL
ncbi:MAG: hypothetical protein K8S98_17750 [Planctomycetes bacterium]|nr:hypothetical protein [Planctomycetota bacterium]